MRAVLAGLWMVSLCPGAVVFVFEYLLHLCQARACCLRLSLGEAL